LDWDPDRKVGVAKREEIAGLSGLEVLQAMIEGRLPAPPISKTLSFRLVEVGDGFCVFEGEPGPHLLNPLGGVHGGWALTLIDSVTGCAAHTTLPPNVGYATIETKASEGRIVDTRGRLLAHGTSTLMVFRAEES
jgi:acyl-coenzyme A thioesterase PaaI-like protein